LEVYFQRIKENMNKKIHSYEEEKKTRDKMSIEKNYQSCGKKNSNSLGSNS
jgi:hypothetical protein